MEEWAKFNNEIQGSPSWLENRRKRIGGSEIAAILQISPYTTRRELWQEKVGISEPKSIGHLPHVKRGVDAEPIARSILERRRGVKYATPTLIHPKYPHIAVSLDGLYTDHCIEIKTMGLKKHLEVMAGEVPDYYQCQCQWGMMIARVPLCIFASYRPEDGSMHEVHIKADKTFQRHMLAKALQFWRWVERRIEPREIDLSHLLK